ncbi:glycosyltransferase [Pseudoxanthomonas sp. 10H]|uniref:glycosyltransferase n=1 Tax=Pseudoxanthomonas sp. 10H TaxID=3242729 RepID=UPI0035575510
MSDGSRQAAAAPLVSVVIPAYKATWLAQALESVRRQTHRPLELVVCDDSRDGRIQALVEAFAATAGFPVHYSRNPSRLWETRSTARAIALASGEYIKFLHDDDVLHDGCIAALVDAFARAPSAVLATARRRLVDEAGTPLADTPATAFPTRDLLLDGHDVVDFLADRTLNFLGEPSAVMGRRAPLLAMGDGLTVLDGVRVTWVADLALYAKLLRHGPVAMLAAPLVDFRVSREQYSQLGRDRPGIGTPGHEAFRSGIRALGWYRAGRETTQVHATPLGAAAAPEPLDLAQALAEAHAVALARWHKLDWQARRRLPATHVPLYEAQLAQLPETPRLGVLVIPDERAPAGACATLDSLAAHAPPGARIEVRVAGEASGAFPAGTVAWEQDAPAASLNAAVAGWDVNWVLVVEAGAEFTGGGLLRLLPELAMAGGLQALYADEWYRDGDGNIAPVLRPDLNLDLLLGNPGAMAGHWILRRSAVLEAGGFDPAHDGAAGFDLVLRLLLAHGLGAFGHLPEPLLACAPPRLADEAQRGALLRHLHERGYPDATVHGAGPGLQRIDYGHPGQPPVSIVVLAGDAPAPLERCVLSVLEHTAWPAYELLLVDHGVPAALRAWMDQVAGLAGGRVRVVDAGPVAPAVARNHAAQAAAGEYLVFLDAGAAVLEGRWLHALLNHGQRPEVGVVGAKTVAADGSITHAGLVPGLDAGGGRVFAGRPMDAGGYMGRLQVAQDYAAVAGSCLLVERTLFEAVGGFDAAAFPDAGADIDLCLRVGAAGRLVVWTPEAVLLHAPVEAACDGAVREALHARWLPALARDPAYHPAMRLDVPGGFELDDTALSWQPLPGRPLPRVLALPSDGHGSGHYRILQPFAALHAAAHVEGATCARPLDVVEVERFAPDVIVMQRRVGDADIARMARLQRFSGAFKVYELDDWLPRLPARNIHRRHMPRDVGERLRRGLAHADRFVVSTPALAEACAGWHADIVVAGNRLDPHLWTALPTGARRPGGKPRVGWAGGVSHDGDLALVAEVVRTLAGEVDWVFFGLCPERLRPHVAEFHPGVPIGQYPRVLAALGLDLAIAPLEDHPFNTCKSNLRLLEYGACGYPVVCSDLEPYRGALPATRVRNRTRDWVEAIRMHLADRAASQAAGKALREAVHRDWMLEGAGLEAWRRAWLPD